MFWARESAALQPFGLHQVEPLNPASRALSKAENPIKGRRLVSGRRFLGRLGTFEKPLKRHVYFENWVALKSGFDLSNFGFQGWKWRQNPELH